MAGFERYAIAVIGGATAGAEAAGIFSQNGILTAVFEQNASPYGKIEDGLPRWHKALRRKEYATIDEKLSEPHVHFVPKTKVGEDVGLRELAEDWGFHVVLLANGAWRDRPLPLEGADAYVGRGLIYQNPFIMWFNHKHEPGYEGKHCEIPDGTVVIGGGLASIDVVKVVQLELTLAALAERGIEQNLIQMEVKGIPKVLAAHGMSWEDLGLAGCTLFYRRRPEDMPLVSAPEGASQVQHAKIEKSRRRVLEKAMQKYLFKVEVLYAPVELIVEAERLAGLVFARTRVEAGKVRITDERLEVRAPLVISSIGSIPEPLAGIAMQGELYGFEDWDLGRLPEYASLFSAGNVVTGKGNIVDSRKHSRKVSAHVTEQYLEVAEGVQKLAPLTSEAHTALLDRIRECQKRVGYAGDYRKWLESVRGPEPV